MQFGWNEKDENSVYLVSLDSPSAIRFIPIIIYDNYRPLEVIKKQDMVIKIYSKMSGK